jgi:hypothetical protein
MAPVFKPRFYSPDDEHNRLGLRPVVFDIISPDGVTSLLPDNIKMILHTNPTTLSFGYQKKVSRTPTLGGWVEYYWGEEPYTITLDMSSGGFMRIGSGLSHTTGTVATQQGVRNGTQDTYGIDLGGTRRETIAYDKYLDLLSLFHNNGSIYDSRGYIAMQGRIKMSFNGGVWFGWFQSFSVSEAAETPFQFKLNCVFQVEREVHPVRTQYGDLR